MMFGGIICISSVFPHYTEYQRACCHILGGINIMHAHWGGIEPVSGPRMEESLHGIYLACLDDGLCHKYAVRPLSI